MRTYVPYGDQDALVAEEEPDDLGQDLEPDLADRYADWDLPVGFKDSRGREY